MWILIASICVTAFIKGLEYLESYLHLKEILDNENQKFEKRLGIDFRLDKERLEALALLTRRNFSNDCLTNRSLFRFKGAQASELEKELAKRD
jgi:hypothetical protein